MPLPADQRSEELLRRDCSSRLGRNELTLFANGTLRLREWEGDETTMRLAEIGRDELDAYQRRLSAGDPGDRNYASSGVSGEWIERCDLHYKLGDGAMRVFSYGRLDTHELAFAAFLRIVDELEALASERAASSSLPADYSPRRGDVLMRLDGARFEVVGLTADGEGVELRGVIDPLTIYIPRSELRQLFDHLVEPAP